MTLTRIAEAEGFLDGERGDLAAAAALIALAQTLDVVLGELQSIGHSLAVIARNLDDPEARRP